MQHVECHLCHRDRIWIKLVLVIATGAQSADTACDGPVRVGSRRYSQKEILSVGTKLVQRGHTMQMVPLPVYCGHLPMHDCEGKGIENGLDLVRVLLSDLQPASIREGCCHGGRASCEKVGVSDFTIMTRTVFGARRRHVYAMCCYAKRYWAFQGRTHATNTARHWAVRDPYSRRHSGSLIAIAERWVCTACGSHRSVELHTA